MTDNALNIPALVTLNVQIDPVELLDSRAPGFDDCGDTVPCGPRLADQIRDAAAHHVARQVKREILTDEFRKELRDSIRAQVDAAVKAALDGEYQPVDNYGSPKGPKTSLRAGIDQHISEWATAKSRDSYNSETNLKRYIREQVDAQIKADLGGVVTAIREQVKGAAQKRITTAVAEVVAGLK